MWMSVVMTPDLTCENNDLLDACTVWSGLAENIVTVCPATVANQGKLPTLVERLNSEEFAYVTVLLMNY